MHDIRELDAQLRKAEAQASKLADKIYEIKQQIRKYHEEAEDSLFRSINLQTNAFLVCIPSKTRTYDDHKTLVLCKVDNVDETHRQYSFTTCAYYTDADFLKFSTQSYSHRVDIFKEILTLTMLTDFAHSFDIYVVGKGTYDNILTKLVNLDLMESTLLLLETTLSSSNINISKMLLS